MRRLILMLLLFVILGRPLAGQAEWSTTFEWSSTTFSAAAHDTSTPQVRVLPWHPALYTIRVAREGSRIGVALGVTYAKGDLAGAVEDIVVLPGSRYTLFELAPEARLRIATTSAGARLSVHAGPVIDLWFPEGDDRRSAYGGIAGLALAIPFTRRWEVEIRSDLAVTGSEVSKAEESAEVIRARTMRRGRLALGITRTF